MAHFYLPKDNGDADLFYEILKKDGKGMRDTTIADARIVGAVPSVNEVTSVVSNYQLVEWLIGEALEFGFKDGFSCCENGSSTDYNESTFAMCRQQWETYRDKAASRGTLLHDLVIEKGLRDGHTLEEPAAVKILDWCKQDFQDKKIAFLEKAFALRKLGYGGRIDIGLEYDNAVQVNDIKTTKRKRQPYNKELCQVVAYRRLINELGIKTHPSRLIYFSSETGEFLGAHVVTDEKLPSLEFEACLSLWTILKRYDPRLFGQAN